MIIDKIKQRLGNQFSRNIGWLGMATVGNRIFRLGTTVSLARLFNPHEYGLMAIIYTINGFAEVFTLRAGINAKIIYADENELATVCQTSFCLNWLFCMMLVVTQCALSYPIATFYGEKELIFPLCAVSVIYLMLPMAMIQSALIQRENRLKIVALSNLIQTLIANLVTICLAWFGFGIWSIILAMVLSTPAWVIVNYLNHSWRPAKKFTLHKWQDITGFGSSMLGIELLDKIRLNLDYLILGRFLGVEALGIYFFAFNAGLGISQSVIKAIVAALFPYLCAVREDFEQLRDRYFSSLKTSAIIIISLVLLQSSLAPFYVPIIFGSKWSDGIPILIIICLSAIPLSFSLATYQLLNSVGKINLTLKWNMLYTVFFALSLLLVAKHGAIWVAVTVLICQTSTLFFSYWATKNVFKTLA